MKMKFCFGGYIWPILQVFALVVCFQGDVSGEIAQGCVGSRLNLTCAGMKIINITDVVLGDSNCRGKSCCIKDNDCTHPANTIHTTNVRSRCDDRQSCIVDVHKQEIKCGYFFNKWSDNDFERITYSCIHVDGPQIANVVDGDHVDHLPEEFDETTKSPNTQHTVDTFSHSSITYENEDTERGNTVATTNAPVYVSSAILGMHGYIGGVVCLIITIGIASAFVAIVIRRKRNKQVGSTDEVRTTDRRETNEYEVTDQNGAQRIRIETPVSHYCKLDVVDRVPRLYEPLVFL